MDTPDIAPLQSTLSTIAPHIGGLKLGLEFFNHNGKTGAKEVLSHTPNIDLFLDLKFHDIPNTVAGAVRGVMDLNPRIINVHVAGGLAMMKRAKEQAVATAKHTNTQPPIVIGVSIMTALDDTDMRDIGYNQPASQQALHMAKLAKKAGLDGVVCSAFEIDAIKKACGEEFITVVPGIRPQNSSADDQKRTMTPKQAIAEGADYIVIGRPITQAEDKKKVLMNIIDTL